jgi:hypothetical protein
MVHERLLCAQGAMDGAGGAAWLDGCDGCTRCASKAQAARPRKISSG